MANYIETIRKHIGHEMLLVAGAGVIVYRDGQILLQKRRDNGCWADHGGCVEIGETLEEAAKRELFEETGLTANRLEFICTLSGKEMFHTYPNGDQVYIIGALFLCDGFSGEINMDEVEVEQLAWFSLDNLPENIHPPIQSAIAECVAFIRKKIAQKQPEHFQP